MGQVRTVSASINSAHIQHSATNLMVLSSYRILTHFMIPIVQKTLSTLNNTTYFDQILHSVGVAIQLAWKHSGEPHEINDMAFQKGQTSVAGDRSLKALSAMCCLSLLLWILM